MRAFALAMGFVALAVLEFERHQLSGVVHWYMAQFWRDLEFGGAEGTRTLNLSGANGALSH